MWKKDTCHQTSRVFPKNSKTLSTNGAHKCQWSVSTQADTTCSLSESTSSPILGKKTSCLARNRVESCTLTHPSSSFWTSQTICHQALPMTNESRHMGQNKPSLGFHTNGLTALTNVTTRVSPPYWCWYSQLRNSFALKPEEYEECKRVFQERGMQTFGDWLEYYNNLDVTPFLETLEKIKAFYTKLGIDIFKDSVLLPGVSMQYILRGTLRRRSPPELYAPGNEAYEMLKAAVVGGPSLVFTRKHVAGQTRIRFHKYDLARIVKRILGFDANSHYPSTMAKNMPCGKETVVHYEDPVQAVKDLIPRMYSKRWFGFAEVDIEVPRDLWEEFEQFPPIFINQSIGAEGVLQHMKDHLAKSGRVAMPDQKKLLGVLKAKRYFCTLLF